MSDPAGSRGGAKERILKAAIACIEREGLERASVRKIAEQAGANVAAINYYFGSKDQLIAEVRDHTLRGALSQALDDLDALLAGGMAVRRAFPKLLEDYIGEAIAYPRIAYVHLREVMVAQDYRTPAARELNRFLEQLLERISPAATALDPGRRRVVLAQIWSNVLLLMLMPRLTSSFAKLDLSSADDRRAYVKTLLAPLLDP